MNRHDSLTAFAVPSTRALEQRATTRGQHGMTLLEVLVAMTLVALGLLAIAPMFVAAAKGNATGGALGVVGAVALERMELLRATDYDALAIGGSTTTNTTGYFDDSGDGYLVRWSVQTNATPPNTKVVTVYAVATEETLGPRREITLTTLRGR